MILVALHRLGVCHGDFEPYNVVVDDKGRPRIVDFGESDEHTCEVPDRKFLLFEDRPEPLELGCDELYETSMDMDLWTPSGSIF